MLSKAKNCDWMRNSFLGNTPIARETQVRISWTLTQEYFRNQVTGILKTNWNLTEAILDIPVTCNLLQGIIKDLSVILLLN